jgi:hypothetical protein
MSRSDHASKTAEVYGRLKEGVHIAGYSFERACENLEYLLEDDRWRTLGFDNINGFIDSVELDHFRILAEQRKRIANRIKELQPSASTRAIGKMLGAHHSTVADDIVGNPTATQQKTQQNQTAAVGNPTASLAGAEAAKLVSRAEAKIEAAERSRERRELSRNAQPLPDGMDYRIGDARELLSDIADNSIPLILTDPAYGHDAEELYRWLAKFAARVLIPGGSLVCLTGSSLLNRDVRIFDEHLRFWWPLVMPHKHGSRRFPGKFVIADHKILLWYVKGHRRGRTLVPGTLNSSAPDKELHPWAQGDGGIWPLIEHLTAPGETIVDPFAGTGEWGRIAVGMGRKWIGCDLELGGTTTVKSDPIAAE